MDRLKHITGQLRPNATIYDTEVPMYQETSDEVCDIKQKFYAYSSDKYSQNVLTESQRDYYEENGYIIIRNLLPKENCNILINRFNELIRNPSIRNREIKIMKDIAYKAIDERDGSNEFKNKSDPTKIAKIQNGMSVRVFTFAGYRSYYLCKITSWI